MRASCTAARVLTLLASGSLLATSLLAAQNGASARGRAPQPQASSPAAAAVPTADDKLLATEGYVTPPDPIARLVTAPRESNFSFTATNPGNRAYLARAVSDGMPTLEQLGRPHYNLGGFQIEYLANRQRALITRSAVAIELTAWESGKKTTIPAPAGARIGSYTWSPDGTTLAYMVEFPTSTQLWIADPATGKSRALGKVSLLATNVTNWEWTADGKSIVAVTVPAARGPEPKEPAVATEPMVRLNEDAKLKTRTSPDLLENPHEEALVEYYTTGQLSLIDVKTGVARPIGNPGMIRSLDASPDGKFFRITYLTKPFSYYLPVSSFGTTEVVIDQTGKTLTTLATRELRTSDPDSTPAPGAGGGRGGGAAAPDTGRRNLGWHPTEDAMVYLQLAPGAPGAKNDSASVASRHDRVMEWLPPFDSTSSRVLYETENRLSAVRFSDNGRVLFVSEGGARGTGEYAVYLDEGGKKFEVIAPSGRGGAGGGRGGRGGGRGGFAGAGAAGGLVTKAGSRGMPVVMISTDGKSVFTQGTVTTPGGRGAAPAEEDTLHSPRIYVDRIEIRTGAKQRLYESSGDFTETISAPLDDDFSRALLQRESRTVVPQSFVLDLATKQARQLTANRDLMPEITNAVRKTVMARRADGRTFKIQVTLPVGYKAGTRLPALFWFYPAEFADQAAYDRGGRGGAGAGGRFPTYGPRTLAFLTVLGYAVIEPDTPIFGQYGQLPNDHYVDDLRDDLYATINALDTLGIIDRERLAIGGHSYGAFSTANAMVHTPYFKAGIAGDGNYNRTLTPNGFQNERRDLWQGRETYLAMSPFLYADHLNGALLMYHSMEDQNDGTDPINSIRMYHALMGLGKTAALYMYPYEDHGPITRETDLDQWARWVAWLDKYVKNPAPATQPAARAPDASPGN